MKSAPAAPSSPPKSAPASCADYGVTDYDASVLASERPLAEYFDTAASGAKKPKNVANWIINDLLSALTAAEKTIAECPDLPARPR